MTTEQLFIFFLRQAIWGTKDTPKTPIEGPVDWPFLLHLCAIHGTGPLVFNEVLKIAAHPTNGICLLDSLKTQMQAVCAQNMMAQAGWKQTIADTWKALTDKGIHPILLKGFALSQLYPLPYLRQWGDLDIWAGIEQYHAACQALCEAFPQAQHQDEEWWNILTHFCCSLPDGHYIELHRVSMTFDLTCDHRYYQQLERDGMAPVHCVPMDMDGLTVFAPELKFNLLFVFVHAWKHFVNGGMPFKQLCDLALLAHTITDRDGSAAYLSRHLRRLHLLFSWRIVGYVLVHALALPQDEWPLYSDSACVRRHGEKLLRKVLYIGQNDRSGIDVNSYEKALQMPLLKRKLKTFVGKFNYLNKLWPYAPGYALYRLWASLCNGVRRTLTGEKMGKYNL